jgi:hypothetical protein
MIDLSFNFNLRCCRILNVEVVLLRLYTRETRLTTKTIYRRRFRVIFLGSRPQAQTEAAHLETIDIYSISTIFVK